MYETIRKYVKEKKMTAKDTAGMEFESVKKELIKEKAPAAESLSRGQFEAMRYRAVLEMEQAELATLAEVIRTAIGKSYPEATIEVCLRSKAVAVRPKAGIVDCKL